MSVTSTQSTSQSVAATVSGNIQLTTVTTESTDLFIEVYPNRSENGPWTFHQVNRERNEVINYTPFPSYFYMDKLTCDVDVRQVNVFFILKANSPEEYAKWDFYQENGHRAVVISKGTFSHVALDLSVHNTSTDKVCNFRLTLNEDNPIPEDERSDPNKYFTMDFLVRCAYTEDGVTTVYSSQDPKIGLGGVKA